MITNIFPHDSHQYLQFPFVNALFQASAAKEMRTAFFWVITQREVTISHRRFGTTYRSHLRGSRTQKCYR